MEERKWWHTATVYQVYPKSFKDSNGDGIGDLAGITEKLDYLQDLGITILWICPFFRSPEVDNGYDISDYMDINPKFGTMADMEKLIEEADRRGISIIMDLVANHCSDQHRWFQEALKGKDNPYRNYFIWRDGKDGKAPNDLKAAFSLDAWQKDEKSGQYYFHQFAVEQPDLNWANPAMRHELYDMMNFWIGKGIKGFRMDVIELIGKDPDRKITANGPMLHPYIEEMARETFLGKNLFTVGECWNANPDETLRYTNGKELDMVFQFDHLVIDEGKNKFDILPFDFLKLKKTFRKWQEIFADRGWYALVWDNHDLARIVSRYGNTDRYWKESAKMLALTLHGMKGTPYVYEGEEIGMTNMDFVSKSQLDDIESINFLEAEKEKGRDEKELLRLISLRGRDNARTPMQWDATRNAGFTSGETTWLCVNPNYRSINVAAEESDPDSILCFYKTLIHMRKEGKYSELLVYGRFDMLMEDDEHIFMYTRTLDGRRLTVVSNWGDSEVEAPAVGNDDRIILSNYRENGSVLKPYETRLYANC